MVGNDITARDYQHNKKLNPSKQHFIGKTPDTTCPTGPYLLTSDELPDPHCLDLSCTVNGKAMQNSNTKFLIHDVNNIIAYCSKLWTLLPGDLIFTGTPSGVGAAMKPPVKLQHGDVVRTYVQHLGTLTNTVVSDGEPIAKSKL
jgi:2-keto-4-pentenoate hydratase/2-oxohepta-3-ene-1,7-dioic acid hydratase in catechol pathway